MPSIGALHHPQSVLVPTLGAMGEFYLSFALAAKQAARAGELPAGNGSAHPVQCVGPAAHRIEYVDQIRIMIASFLDTLSAIAGRSPQRSSKQR
jgi:hypothetical protein